MRSFLTSEQSIVLILKGGILLFVMALLLLVLVVGVRMWGELIARRRTRCLGLYRPLFERALHETPTHLPAVPASNMRIVLALWNNVRHEAHGEAVERLIEIGNLLGFALAADRLSNRRYLPDRMLGVLTLGNLHCRDSYARILALVLDANPSLSLTAVRAVLECDPMFALPAVLPQIAKRVDWSPAGVATILRRVHTRFLVEVMEHVLDRVPSGDKVRLLKYIGLLGMKEFLPKVRVMLRRHATENELVSALIRVIGQFGDSEDLPTLREHILHPSWFVRVQAITGLGHLGNIDDEGPLIAGLYDAEWWVRYRAAQTLLKIPAIGLVRVVDLFQTIEDEKARSAILRALAERTRA